MRNALLNVLLPLMALGLIWTVTHFQSPGELRQAMVQQVEFVEIADVSGELTDVRPLIQQYAGGVPGLDAALTENADCFVGLGQADQAKLDRCAQPVIETIAQVMAHQDNPVIREALTSPVVQGNLLGHLKLAAVEVCRATWAGGRTADHGLDSPACQMAQVQLVSHPRN